jgi:hypothetical protein
MQAKIEAPPRRFKYTNSFGNHLFPDAVSSDDRDVEGFNQLLLPLTKSAR